MLKQIGGATGFRVKRIQWAAPLGSQYTTKLLAGMYAWATVVEMKEHERTLPQPLEGRLSSHRVFSEGGGFSAGVESLEFVESIAGVGFFEFC